MNIHVSFPFDVTRRYYSLYSCGVTHTPHTLSSPSSHPNSPHSIIPTLSYPPTLLSPHPYSPTLILPTRLCPPATLRSRSSDGGVLSVDSLGVLLRAVQGFPSVVPTEEVRNLANSVAPPPSPPPQAPPPMSTSLSPPPLVVSSRRGGGAGCHTGVCNSLYRGLRPGGRGVAIVVRWNRV